MDLPEAAAIAAEVLEAAALVAGEFFKQGFLLAPRGGVYGLGALSAGGFISREPPSGSRSELEVQMDRCTDDTNAAEVLELLVG